MCKRRKLKNKQKTVKKGNRKVKKKLTCCQKCRRRIRIWLCRRIKRCFKRAIFGDPNPRLDEYEIAGINLGDIKDTFKRENKDDKVDTEPKDILNTNSKISVKNKPTVITLFRNNRKKLPPIKEAIVDELDRYSLYNSIGSKVKSFIDGFRERNIFLGISKDSGLNMNDKEKARIRKLAQKYEKKNNLEDLDNINSYEKLKDKFSLSPSKVIVLQNMLDDYKNGFLFNSDLKKQLTDIHNISKENMKRMIARYESQKIRLRGEDKSNFSFNILKNMNSNDLKKKLSLSNSNLKNLQCMIKDYEKEKIALSTIPPEVRENMKKINKKNVKEILDYYKSQQKHFPFVKQSKLKQLKSNLRAKLSFL